jgi:ABC-type dipeptide/oligopeptide/nickel transport system ATPase component
MSRDIALLTVKGLTVDHFLGEGSVRAVDNVSFSIKAGQIFALVGESGCGKTTIALAIMRLIQPGQGRIVMGEVVFEGQRLTDLSEKQMRKIRGSEIAMAFQEPAGSFNPVLTIGHQIAEAIMLHRGKDARQAWKEAVEVLELVGIVQGDPPQRARCYPHQLSGGMQQRAMIAIALSCRPRLLIADEPTSALDAAMQAEILGLLDRLRRQAGMSILLITHDLRVAERYADIVAVMSNSRIVEMAEPSVLFARPGHPYTQGLLKCVAQIEDRRQNTEYRT